MLSKTKLIVADDHPLSRSALREAIMRVLPGTHILEAGSLPALEQAVEANPDTDLVLLDLHMPGAIGFAALSELRAQYPSTPVAIISATESASVVGRAMDLGASGFIPKSASIEQIGAMLRALLHGHRAIPHDGVESISEMRRFEPASMKSISNLTAQQTRVLLLLAEGSSNKSIAHDLGVSEATIKAHVTVILRKLGFERRTQAALLAQRLFHGDLAELATLEQRVFDGTGT